MPRSPGVDGRTLDRNAMGLRDARRVHGFGWDGGADSLWAFVLRPLLDPREIGADARLAALFARDPALACRREAAFGPPPSDAGRPYMAAPGRPDPGRHGGIRSVLTDPYNRLGRWSDAATPEAAVRTRHLAPSHRNFGEFRTPGLRGLADTAPDGHDGSMATLNEVVAHYSDLDIERLHADGEALLRPLKLDPGARADLFAFLRTLSEPAGPDPAPSRTAAAVPICWASGRTQP